MNSFWRNNGLLLIIIVAIFGIGAYLHYKKSKKLSLKQSYVIGVIIERSFHSKGSASIKFSYAIDSRKYSMESFEERKRVKVGERYLVSIPDGYEDEGIILLASPVPDGIEAPKKGWDVKPDF